MKKIYNILRAVLIGSLFLTTSCSEDCEHLVLNGNDAFITSCVAKIGFGSSEGTIVGDTIFISVPTNVILTAMKVELVVSENATVLPLPHTVTEWEKPVLFTVTSANQEVSKKYIVVVQKVAEENVFPGYVRFGSQKEVDGFGQNGYTKVGGVILYNNGGGDPIVDLSPLDDMREIIGGLTIQGLGMRLIVINNLEKVGRFLMQSPTATKIRLPMLKFVAGEFQIGENGSGIMPVPHISMEEVSLPSLEYVGGNFILFGCEKLKTLESLAKLSHVGNDFVIDGGTFKTLKGLEKLTKVDGNFTINGLLSSLDGFAVEHVKGHFFMDIENVTSLDGLKTLKTLGNMFELSRNRYLKDLKGLENIQSKMISISNFLVLESLEGLSIQPEMDYLALKAFYALKDLSALSVLKRVNGDLSLQGLMELETLHGLENLEHIGGTCRVETMPKLTDMSALNNLDFVGQFSLVKIELLEQLPVFSKLTETESIYIQNLIALKNLDGFESMTKITRGQLAILACSKLTDISGLRNITNVELYGQKDRIWFEQNLKLASYCPILPLLKKYMDVPMRMDIKNNYYNPTKDDLTADKCEGVGGAGIASGW